MAEQLNQLLKEWQSLLPKVKNKLSQLTATISQKNTLQTQLTEITQQKTSLQNQINQLQKQVLTQSDKNLLSQCVNALTSVNNY
jgi:chromosome segregation ATPase